MDYRYWDSATFLGWLSEEPDKVPEIKPVLDAAEGGNIMLVTSAVTIPEDAPHELAADLYADRIDDGGCRPATHE